MNISVQSVRFDEDNMWVDLSDGRTLGIPLAWVPKLLRAKSEQLLNFELSPSGIHWDELDEDISVEGLLAGRGVSDAACMDRCLIVFELDTKCLEKQYHNNSLNYAYADIQRVLNKHRFNNIQGTVYLSEIGVRQVHGTLAIQEVAIRFPWFEKCVSNVQFYDLADDFNAQFIVDGIAQAREAFECRVTGLRQQLIAAGLSSDKVDEIIGQQTFSLENATQSFLPQD